MESIKRNYKKIISYGLIGLGVFTLILVFVLRMGRAYYWCGIFTIAVGLTLFSLTKDTGAKK